MFNINEHVGSVTYANRMRIEKGLRIGMKIQDLIHSLSSGS